METQPSCTLSPATLYYDGRCPLCTKEMTRLQALKEARLSLVDIHSLTGDAALPDRDQLLRTLHLRREDGHIVSGIEANVLAWQYTRRGKWFRWMLWPPVRFFSTRIYTFWAQWRYRRLYGSAATSSASGSHAPH